ncbi:MAG TPA: hypothetical protein VGX23_38380, partial [Actinocrinis sp.]|nr:hypothetical protein [Actinocrinis sp.]
MPLLVVAALALGQSPGAAGAGPGAAAGLDAHSSLVANGVSSPTLTFANATAQSTLGTAYNLAIKNLLTTNTVPYDASTYNTSGLMQSPPGTFIRAGGGYSQPWTRDASVNSWNAASLL